MAMLKVGLQHYAKLKPFSVPDNLFGDDMSVADAFNVMCNFITQSLTQLTQLLQVKLDNERVNDTHTWTIYCHMAVKATLITCKHSCVEFNGNIGSINGNIPVKDTNQFRTKMHVLNSFFYYQIQRAVVFTGKGYSDNEQELFDNDLLIAHAFANALGENAQGEHYNFKRNEYPNASTHFIAKHPNENVVTEVIMFKQPTKAFIIQFLTNVQSLHYFKLLIIYGGHGKEDGSLQLCDSESLTIDDMKVIWKQNRPASLLLNSCYSHLWNEDKHNLKNLGLEVLSTSTADMPEIPSSGFYGIDINEDAIISSSSQALQLWTNKELAAWIPDVKKLKEKIKSFDTFWDIVTRVFGKVALEGYNGKAKHAKLTNNSLLLFPTTTGSCSMMYNAESNEGILFDSALSQSFRDITWKFVANYVTNIPLCIISHWDEDHLGGLWSLINTKYKNKQVPELNNIIINYKESWFGGRSAKQLKQCLNVLKDLNMNFEPWLRNKAAVYTSADEATKIYVFNPKSLPKDSKMNQDMQNKLSICSLVKHNNFKLIFTGDAHQTEILNGLKFLAENSVLTSKTVNESTKYACDYFEVPHHGSNNSMYQNDNPEQFYKQIEAKYFGIGAGFRNHHGHPTLAVIRAIRSANPNAVILIPMTKSQLENLCTKKKALIFTTAEIKELVDKIKVRLLESEDSCFSLSLNDSIVVNNIKLVDDAQTKTTSKQNH